MKKVIHILLIFVGAVAASTNLAGFRDVQIRSNTVVTAWLGYMATSDSSTLYDASNYIISSPDDADYKNEIHPAKISRFSKGSRSANGPQDWRALSDQLMHLHVGKPFKSGKRYFIKLSDNLIPRDFQRTRQFSLDRTPNPSFKLNQVGYSNQAQTKLVYLSSYLGDGEPVDLSGFESFSVINNYTSEIVLDGDIKFVSDKDPQGHDKLYVLDISDLKAEGEFYIKIVGFGRSYSFKNGPVAAKAVYDIISRGMYFQRCGAELVQPYAGLWEHDMSHNNVYVTTKNIVHPWDIEVDPANPNAGDYYVPDGPREIHGGHHDAGDYDTRLTHMAVPDKLLSLYEALPEKFYDGQAFIPENDNGIPDILDEAAWSLLHWEYLQDYFGEVHGEFGAVPPGMESWKHPPVYPTTGDGDMLPYYTRKATPYSSFCGAAIFAQAARVFREFDEIKSAKFLERATAAYEYAVKHRKEKWEPENPKVLPLDWEEVYDKGSLNTAWCWAASQLYSTTSEKHYFKAFTKRYQNVTTVFKQYPWRALYPIAAVKHDNVDEKIVAKVRAQILEKADADVQWILDNGKTGYQAACPNRGDWGFACPITKLESLWYAYYLTKEEKYKNAIATSIDFQLGMNPSEMSWMTGAGTVYPLDPLSSNSKYDGVEEPQPGIVIFGPGDSWNHPQNPLYPNPEEMGFYRRISDVWGYVQGCEYVVDEQQVNMYVSSGILLPDKK